MNACLQRGAALGAITFLLSCGGGGGGDEGNALSPAISASVPSEYIGTFAGACEPADDVTVVLTGQSVSVRSYLVLEPRSGNVARAALRFDFHEDASCATAPVAYLPFDDPGNQVAFDGSRTVDGRAAQLVTLTLAAARGGTPVAGGRMEFGNAVRLSAPAQLLAPLSLKDLWLSDGTKLYQGVMAAGPDGYPTTLDLDTVDVRVAEAPPMQ